MKDYHYIKQQIINKHKNIDNLDYLNKYINLLLNYVLEDDNLEYTENHHILPVATFPEYKQCDWNLITVKYEDHKLAHLYLFKSINIRTYQRPLNWMMKDYKNSKELSNASKHGWIKLKNDKEKFDDFKMKRSKHMKTLSSEEQSRRANIFWKNITDSEYIDFCEHMKNIWTKEKKEQKSKSMINHYKILENKHKKSIETQKRWDDISPEEKLKFDKKMNIVNNDLDKRKSAGDSIKKLWKDKEYLEKMKNRKKKQGTKIRLINLNQEIVVFETMILMSQKCNFSVHLIRKYKDTNTKISKNDSKSSEYNNISLENCIIETIKNS